MREKRLSEVDMCVTGLNGGELSEALRRWIKKEDTIEGERGEGEGLARIFGHSITF